VFDAVYRTETSGLVGLWVFQHRNDTVAVRVRKIGYADTAFVVMVGVADTAPVSVFLRKATTLPTVIAEALASKRLSPNMEEFEDRLNDKSLTGRFLTKEELDKHSSKPILDVIHDLMAGKHRGCDAFPKLFVDGVRTPFEAFDTTTTADNYQGIEFYTPAAGPLRFGGTSDPTSSSAGTMVSSKSASKDVVAGTAGPKGSAASIRASSSCGVVVLWSRERP
jgi:hypothetical protein